MMNYDHSFDQNRLTQLSNQYLSSSAFTGRVLFQSDPEDNRLAQARWEMTDAAFEELKSSGFKQALMELLDVLIIYRAKHSQPNGKGGVVYMNGSELKLEWFS